MQNYSSEKSPEEYKMEFEKMSPEEQENAIQNPGHADESKWKRAKEISKTSYGEIRWPFVMWMYQRLIK
jgi:hypothetical protein